MKKILILMTIFMLNLSAMAQYGASWTPVQVFVGDTLTIYFDASQAWDQNFPSTNSNMTLHWGVNETGPGDWQTPDASTWPQGTVLNGIAARSPMTLINGTTWMVKIPTNQTIQTLHFVFNNGTPSTFGPNWAHNGSSSANWNLQLYQRALTAEFVSPTVSNPYGEPERSPEFLGAADVLQVKGTAVTSNATIDSLYLLLDNVRMAEEGQKDTIIWSLNAADFSDGMHRVSLIVKSDNAIRDTTFFSVVINPTPNQQSRPNGIRDGINYISENSAVVSLFAPYKQFVYVIGDFNDWKVNDAYLMNAEVVDPDTVHYWLQIDGLTPGVEYGFQYLVDGEIRIADPYTEKILDPYDDKYIEASTYPNLKPYPSGKTAHAVSVLETGQMPYNWTAVNYKRPAQEDLVVYEVLLRDFLDAHDFKTLTDSIPYFVKLGVNAIELMPVSEFEGNLSWGYNPSFYMAPDKYYGPEEDMKRFIDVCHQNNMAVIMDMVLNHSYGQSPLVRLYWDEANNRPAANNPWYNETSPNQTFSWGYDFDHESPATHYFVDRVTSHWLSEYHVDGFRFDFSKGFTNTPGDGGSYDASRIAILERMADKIWAVDDSAYVILEHFTDNEEEKELVAYKRGMMVWGNSNYNYNEATMGWNGNSDFSWGYYGTRGMEKPGVMTYMESHDEERLMYKNLQWGNSYGSYDVQDTVTALQRMKLAGAFFFLYPGPKMIWQFGELGYDYSINWPSGDSKDRLTPKPARWDYFQQTERRKLFETWATLINLRKNYDVFNSPQTSVDLSLNDASGFKRIILQHPSMNVRIIGNFGVEPINGDPAFLFPGRWYDYFSGDSLDYVNGAYSVMLQPGEFKIYTSQKLPLPDTTLLTALSDISEPVPQQFEVFAAYPNPFNPETSIRFYLPRAAQVDVAVFNIMGQRVRILQNDLLNAGPHQIKWDGRNNQGVPMPTGIYMIRLQAGEKVHSQKVLLVK